MSLVTVLLFGYDEMRHSFVLRMDGQAKKLAPTSPSQDSVAADVKHINLQCYLLELVPIGIQLHLPAPCGRGLSKLGRFLGVHVFKRSRKLPCRELFFFFLLVCFTLFFLRVCFTLFLNLNVFCESVIFFSIAAMIYVLWDFFN